MDRKARRRAVALWAARIAASELVLLPWQVKRRIMRRAIVAYIGSF